jgi:uncharacterized protein (DUF1778 family)
MAKGRAPVRSGRLERMVSVRLTPDEVTLIREEAARRGISVSNLVRLAALRECRPALQVNRPVSSFTAATDLESISQSQTLSQGSESGTGVISRK